MAGARFAVFVGEAGVERVVPGGTGLKETEAALRLYGTLREDVEEFDRAIRRRLNALLDVAIPERSVN